MSQRRRRKGSYSRRKRIQRRRRIKILFGLLLFCSIAVLVVSYMLFQGFVSKYPAGKIYENVYIGSVDVSGMTEQEAGKMMEKRLSQGRQAAVTMKVGEKEEKAVLEELGLKHKGMEKQVRRAFEYGKSGSLWKRFWQLKKLSGEKKVFEEKFVLSTKKARNLVEERIVPLAEHAQNATIERKGNEFIITGGKQGKTINVEKSLAALSERLNNGWDCRDFSIEMTQIDEKPSVSAEELKTVKDVLGSYSTDAGGGDRWQNLKTGVEKIDGTVLAPGEEISIHDVTAPYDAEHGYVAAGSYENGQVVDTYGGGICQVSTTLYNAVLFSELEVTKRYPHSMLVTYVEPSRDAAIAGDVKDFRFKNSCKTPIYIEGEIDGDNQLKFTIYGKDTRKKGRTVEYESEVTATEEYGRTYREDSDAPLGSIGYEGNPHTGKTARLWKIIKQDGEKISRDVINESRYQKSDEIIVVGTASDNGEASALVRNAIATQDGEKVNEAIRKARGLGKNEDKTDN